jgi:ketosteroid isomerase-like protein
MYRDRNMTSSSNKQLLQNVFAELAKGNGRPFVDSMADDFSWTITGQTKWSRTYAGKHVVIKELLAPLRELFANQYTATAQRVLAEDDYVVVQCRGNVTTKSGKPYNNEYCWVIRFEDGKMRELTEYLDTELVNTALSG